MRKELFLERLEEALEEVGFSKSERKDIVEDYQAIIEEALERGEEEGSFIQKLGSVKEIVKQLKKTQKGSTSSNEKWIAVSPFIALISFFTLGLGFNLWHPGWLSFLLVPILAIVLETKGREKIVAVSPLIITVVFILVGTYTGLWNPYWSLYVLVFAFGLAASKAPWLRQMGIVPVTSVIVYIGLFYQYPDLSWWVPLLVFLPVIPLVYVSGVVQIRFSSDVPHSWWAFFKSKQFWLSVGLLVASGALYLGLYWVSGLWHPTWLVFLSIPVGLLLYGQVVKKESVPLVAYIPFASLVVFFLVGHFLNGYAYSWMAFLAIPIVAILTDHN